MVQHLAVVLAMVHHRLQCTILLAVHLEKYTVEDPLDNHHIDNTMTIICNLLVIVSYWEVTFMRVKINEDEHSIRVKEHYGIVYSSLRRVGRVLQH